MEMPNMKGNQTMKSRYIAGCNAATPARTITKAGFIAAAVVLAGIGFAQMARAAGAPPSSARSEVPQCSAEQGQIYIDQGRYRQAIREFTCLIDANPTEVEGYRGCIEAELLFGSYSDAVRDYARVTAFVLPVHPDAENTILAGYAARLSVAPYDIPALTGVSFAHWWFFEYPAAIHVLNDLLALRPNDVYGNLFRGSSRLLQGTARAQGAADLEHAIALEPQSPDVRFVVADAYTYGKLPDPQRAFMEASFALAGGLDTPRVHAILASAYLAFGNQAAAAAEIQRHIELVTTQLLMASPLNAGDRLTLPLVPGRTYEIPVPATAGETISVLTSSPDFYDTILVLLAPDGTPVLGSDDYRQYFAGFEWVATATGTYRMWVTSFEAVNTGDLVVSRR
jgi:tetratricopeptide (TPR) repeat protein